mgnify:FL=1|tara:strand:- start:1008 stop:1280 length:273 start_codon:yes stop_codon:yes gene_type:complete
MTYNNFKYSKKHDSYRALVNVYNFNSKDLEVNLRADYKIVISDNIIKDDVIVIPERIKIQDIQCHFVDDNNSILMIELRLKDLDIQIKWK